MITALYLLAVLFTLLYLRRLWHLEGYSWRCFFTDTRDRLRWRRLIGSFGFFCVGVGTRCMEIAQRKQTPSGGKLIVRVRKEWESRAPVEAFRDGNAVVVFAGSRFLRFK